MTNKIDKLIAKAISTSSEAEAISVFLLARKRATETNHTSYTHSSNSTESTAWKEKAVKWDFEAKIWQDLAVKYHGIAKRVVSENQRLREQLEKKKWWQLS